MGKLMDINKDGTIDKNDLRGAFDNVVKMFQEKMAGEGNDPDDLITQAFKSYDNEGKIDVKIFQEEEEEEEEGRQVNTAVVVSLDSYVMLTLKILSNSQNFLKFKINIFRI